MGSVNKLTLLAQYGYQLVREHHVDKLIDLLAAQVRELLEADRCSVFILDPEKNELYSRVAHGVEGQILYFSIDSGVVGHVARTGETLNIKNAYQHAHFNPESDLKNNYKTQTILCMPMKNLKKQVLGVFQVLNKRSGVFTDEDEGLLSLLSSIAAATLENMELHKKVIKSEFETITRLLALVQLRDTKDLAGHLSRMSQYSRLIAEALGWSEEETELIYMASPMHDIGKVGVPDSILLADRQLTPEEYEEMKKHTVYGHQILEDAESDLLKMARNVAVAHHERYDGSGYPHGLKGEQIPLEARIVAVADVFDALISRRVYKQGWEYDTAVDYILKWRGQHFDPVVVDAFVKCLPQIQELLKNG
jgi:HD-GYP domain-containing protein (c-di-GMP phosphodiesterase class II)